MDNNDNCLIGEPDALNIFKTLYLFLQNHNFPKSAETLLEEWGMVRSDIAKIPNKSLFLAKCECDSKNQTHLTCNLKRSWEETDDTHLFYVCDCERKGQCCKHQGATNGHLMLNDVKQLKSKFIELQEEHQKLIAVTGELTTALQTNIIGQTKSVYTVLNRCKTIYPTLFHFDETPENHPETDSDSDMHLEGVRSDFLQSPPKSSYVARSVQFPEPDIPKPAHLEKETQHCGVEPLNLEGASQVNKAPLTPETVRYVLEMVFDKIFEIEKTQSPLVDPKNTSTLSKENVEKIVEEVLMETVSSPSPLGAGEGEPMKSRIEDERTSRFFHVDFVKLKNDMIRSDDEKKIRILQALRWRITKNDSITRSKVLDSYIANDVLDLHSPISIPERNLLGYGTDQYVQEATCRLINTLASLKQGRDYLTMEKRLLRRVLIKKVRDVRHINEPLIRNMMVAAVQKLSIRKQCRIQMVHDGLFEALVDYLDDFLPKMSKYCLEYCSALLMNLCLVDEAKIRATKNINKIIGLLKKCLNAGDSCCLPYINGVMFSLFEKNAIVEEAMRQQLDKLIIYLIQGSANENTKKQLEFVLQSRLFGKSEPIIRDADEDSKEEVDMLEIELDQEDFVTKLPSGEELLYFYKTDFTVQDDNPVIVPINTSNVSPTSVMSFSEETKRFYHKPTCENGIFDAEKHKRFGSNSQNLIRNYMKNKLLNGNPGRFPATPLCYMENCQRIEKGGAVTCTCSTCQPGQSRYSCGCYDAIRQEVDDVTVDIHSARIHPNTEIRKNRW
ncbi:uncharacterized protein LOC126741404 isoform X2 [Anthonomus grandis grandis]|uniref:uncharacterized protein LOC126741404 isoform X2 n=1 Tax=Anthonomus grandis grandis TaxID=2921223 RepID=UPI00216674FB|nr:uncharacterized protein LOC126741404 isoform X2 [Anthonomus grandis grandis]